MPPTGPGGSFGSRRRRLWELEPQAHCPVIGVCLPIAALRRLIDRLAGNTARLTDYELHSSAVNRARARTRIAEALQKELERRHQPALRIAARLRTTQALEQWWQEAVVGKDVGGALWAVLTHARCTPALEHEVLNEIHMLQHQAGAASRVDLARFDALLDENAVLAGELAKAQQRASERMAAFAREADAHRDTVQHLRVELAASRAAHAATRDELASLQANLPELADRERMIRERERQRVRIDSLQAALAAAREALVAERRRGDDARASRPGDTLDAGVADPSPTAGATRDTRSPAIASPSGEPSPPALADRAVLCVGGKPALVPAYRRMIEQFGAHFMHHDGGDEDGIARLDSTLAAADLVICQAGCISHGAYWRLKDHCKRTGKPCVFVESPSRASLARALCEVRSTASGARSA
ncbi:MAG: DUF2325 domain-containing protein [Lautropia sp.]